MEQEAQNLNYKIEHTLGQLVVLEQLVLAIAAQNGTSFVEQLRSVLHKQYSRLPTDPSPQSKGVRYEYEKLSEALASLG